MNEADRAKSEQINRILGEITSKMNAKKFSDDQIQKAHMLYFGALYEKADDEKFVDNLVACFKDNQSAIAFERVYERCGDYANEDSRRANNAEAAYNKFHK